MGTYTGRDRFGRTEDGTRERESGVAGADFEEPGDLLHDVLGELPNPWEMMLRELPPGARKRERRSALR
jgi:hypothetical protein